MVLLRRNEEESDSRLRRAIVRRLKETISDLVARVTQNISQRETNVRQTRRTSSREECE